MYTKGDFLIRIKNAYMANKKEVELSYSKENFAIGKILEQEGFIKKIIEEKKGSKKFLQAVLLYKNRKPSLISVKIISKPSVHIYKNKSKINLLSYGVTIVSTSHGIMSGKEARAKGFGGEVICQIY